MNSKGVIHILLAGIVVIGLIVALIVALVVGVDQARRDAGAPSSLNPSGKLAPLLESLKRQKDDLVSGSAEARGSMSRDEVNQTTHASADEDQNEQNEKEPLKTDPNLTAEKRLENLEGRLRSR